MKAIISHQLPLISITFIFLFSSSLFAQWEPDRRLTFNDSTSSISSSYNARCIAAIENIVHLVWYDLRDGKKEIYYKQSNDGGTTWTEDTRLTKNTASSSEPSVVASNKTVHVVWEDNRDGHKEVYYKRSTDCGITWNPDYRLTNDSITSQSPAIAIWSSNIHIVWLSLRNGKFEIRYKRSTDDGLTWSKDTSLTRYHPGIPRPPSIAVSKDHVHLAWGDNFWDEIFYKKSIDGGKNWSKDTLLTNTGTVSSQYPTIAASGSMCHLVWCEGLSGHDGYDPGGNYQIYYKGTTDGGKSWTLKGILSSNERFSALKPSIAVSGLKIHVVWVDFRVHVNNPEIFYTRSTNGGKSWERDVRLTNASGESILPCVVASGSRVHVIWIDDRVGNWEIFYKSNPTGNR